MESITVTALLDEARRGLRRSTPHEAWAEIDDGAILIDIRCDSERAETGVVPGAIPIARSVLEWRCDPSSGHSDDRVARPDERVLLLCAHGYSSSLAAASLRRLGFAQVGDVVGGMEAWLDAELPVLPG